MQNFQELNKIKVEFPGVITKTSSETSRGSYFLAVLFPRDVTQFYGISRVGFGKIKNKKHQGFIMK